LQGLKRFIWGSRKRKVLSALAVLALVISASATAAFFLFSGVDSTTDGSFSTAPSTAAITVSSSAGNPTLTPGGPAVSYPLVFHNNDPDAAHTITANSLSFVAWGSGTGCAASVASAFTLNGTYAAMKAAPIVVPAGGNNTTAGAGVTIAVSNSIAPGCSGGVWELTFSGTTT